MEVRFEADLALLCSPVVKELVFQIESREQAASMIGSVRETLEEDVGDPEERKRMLALIRFEVDEVSSFPFLSPLLFVADRSNSSRFISFVHSESSNPTTSNLQLSSPLPCQIVK